MARQPRTRRRRDNYQAPAERAPASAAARSSLSASRRARPAPAASGRGGFRGFVAESIGELKKVEWPGKHQLFSATVVVIIAVAVVGAYLWIADLALSHFVKNVLLNL
jgi:preprotein translocase subunit SecE